MYASPSELTPSAPHECRHHERTHLFLAAVLYSKAGSCPVHVRDISPTGALIEGSILPDKGEELVVKRAGLEASARIVWKADRKAGVAFTTMIHVAEWMSKQASVHQGRVDNIIQDIRSGGAICPSKVIVRPLPPLSMIEAELEALKTNLTQLEHGLIGDVVLIATHPEIQLLDVALQSVDRMLLGLRQLPTGS